MPVSCTENILWGWQVTIDKTVLQFTLQKNWLLSISPSERTRVASLNPLFYKGGTCGAGRNENLITKFVALMCSCLAHIQGQLAKPSLTRDKVNKPRTVPGDSGTVLQQYDTSALIRMRDALQCALAALLRFFYSYVHELLHARLVLFCTSSTDTVVLAAVAWPEKSWRILRWWADHKLWSWNVCLALLDCLGSSSTCWNISLPSCLK